MKQSTKTLILWVVLIGLFVGFYKMFEVPPGERTAERSSSMNSALVTGAIFLGVFVLFIVWAKRFSAGPWVTLANEGHQAFNAGYVVEALEKWTQSAALKKNQPLPRYNMGVARLCLWQLQAAREDFDAAVKMNPSAKMGGDIKQLVHAPLALIFALQNRPGDARAELAQVTDKRNGNASLAEAVLLLRDAKYSEAHAVVRRSEVLNLAGTVGALARAMDAWCAFLLFGQQRWVDRIALFNEAHPDGLRAAWPELVEFVERSPS